MGWFGEPAISGVREGGDDAIFWSATTIERRDQALVIRLVDQRMLLRVELSYTIDQETGVLASRASIYNDDETVFRLRQADSLCLPLPSWAADILCMSGDWSREAQPFRLALSPGAWSQTNRTGRTGFRVRPLQYWTRPPAITQGASSPFIWRGAATIGFWLKRCRAVSEWRMLVFTWLLARWNWRLAVSSKHRQPMHAFRTMG